MGVALSKTLDPADLTDLAEELVVVDQHFGSASPQHDARKWEYSLALRAPHTWEATQPPSPTVRHLVDIGGAGSPFVLMPGKGYFSISIDPVENHDLSTYLGLHPPLADVVTCLSVLEHVDDLDRFLYHLGCLVAPGGLLVLTMDCWDREGPDTAHFHWMRRRIFTVEEWGALAPGIFKSSGAFRDFDRLGDADWAYHGDQLYTPGPGGYSIASLALVKRS